MSLIEKATPQDAALLSRIGGLSFAASHGESATHEIIDAYVAEKYSCDVMQAELDNPDNIYYIIYHDGRAAGYSKMLLNAPYDSTSANITKLERLYLLQEYYGLKLGHELLQHNINLSAAAGQAGMWLYTWQGNKRAIDFYRKAGFIVTGTYDFRITDTHSNPNYRMLLIYP